MHKLNTRTVIGVGAGLAVIALFFWYGVPSGVQGTQQTEKTQSAVPDQEQLASVRTAFGSIAPKESDFSKFTSGVRVFEFTVGTGAEVQKDKSVAIHYVARFANGVQFDSSVDRGQPLLFEYGKNQLIPGFEAGLAGARVGSIRRIIVPPELGYGKTGVKLQDGTVLIPPNATLVFDVAVINVGQ